jgi:hypothetical protein
MNVWKNETYERLEEMRHTNVNDISFSGGYGPANRTRIKCLPEILISFAVRQHACLTIIHPSK